MMPELSDLIAIVEYAIRKACLYCWKDDVVPQSRFDSAHAHEIANDLVEALISDEVVLNNSFKKVRMRNKTGYRGVLAHQGKWIARFNRRYQGMFDSSEEAARAYDRAVIEHLWNRGILNFPPHSEKK